MHCGTTFVALALLLAPCFQSTAEPGAGDKRDPVLSERAVLYEINPVASKNQRFAGTVVWRLAVTPPKPGATPELAWRAEVEIPERGMRMSWSLRRNTDKSLPASHIIEIKFKLPTDFSEGGVDKLYGVMMKTDEDARGVPLVGMSGKASEGHFLMALSADETDRARNILLLKERRWFDISIYYTSGKRAILTMEKE